MKQKHLDHYMRVVDDLASLSHAKRKQVGALVITPNGSTFEGINGTFPGHDNTCEYESQYRRNTAYLLDDTELQKGVAPPKLITKQEVYHAEANAFAKMLEEGVSARGSTLCVTLSPCFECCKWIARAGVKTVIYKERYRDTLGLEFLKRCNVEVIQYKKVDENV